ncbi:MAG: NAD-dependent epimerase/dehydratase family protein [Pikeienuella sp.]|uniref:NAD-dependent epimerase/dehydratase family protein n=1 Tax=Pikeienuella sp. TaxID=2831957 RepID=UPI0039189F58
MRVLVTGSSGHLGEALMRILPAFGHEPSGLDMLPGPFTAHVGSVADAALVRRAMAGMEGVIHAATLHKPQVASLRKQDFIDANVAGTLTLLEAAAEAGARRFVFTSTTSAFGDALVPPPGAPAAWIDEDAPAVPKNIYGVTKTAAEDLCALFARDGRLSVVILRTSRFFPEPDDDAAAREGFADANLKANELLYRRVDIEDAAEAHELALRRAPEIGFAKFVVSATTPFAKADLPELRRDPAPVIARTHPECAAIYAEAGFRPPASIDRVYVNARARAALGWAPRWDFAAALRAIAEGRPLGSDLGRAVGAKGYPGAKGVYGAR